MLWITVLCQILALLCEEGERLGLNVKRWLKEKLGGDKEVVSSEELIAGGLFGLSADLYVRELAFWSCVQIVANAVSKCEFQTVWKGAERKGEEYYLWNIEPNQNQNSSAFLHQLIAQLYQYNEVLVIEQSGRLLIADRFTRKPYALYEDVFSQVTVGDLTFQRTFVQSEVLYFTLHERDMRPIINGLYESYRKLLDYGMKGYQRSRGIKGTLSIDGIPSGEQKVRKAYEDLKNGGFRNFASAESAMMTLYKGMDYTDLGSKSYSQEGTRDIRAMIDDVSDFTAKAFGIPAALLRGDVQGITDALDQFLTFCIDPLTDMLSEEINRKRCGRAVLEGTYVRIDTKCIKHVDLLSVANAVDKLISSGAFCVNDIRLAVGELPIEEPWAWKHFMTKNYSTVQDIIEALQNEGTSI